MHASNCPVCNLLVLVPHNTAFIIRETPRTPGSSAEVEQLLSCAADDDETRSSCDIQQDELETIRKTDAARTALDAEAARTRALLSPLAVLRLLVRRTAFWHLTLAKALLLCVAIGSFAWMPTFYVRRGSLSIEEVRHSIAVCLCSLLLHRRSDVRGVRPVDDSACVIFLCGAGWALSVNHCRVCGRSCPSCRRGSGGLLVCADE